MVDGGFGDVLDIIMQYFVMMFGVIFVEVFVFFFVFRYGDDRENRL